MKQLFTYLLIILLACLGQAQEQQLYQMNQIAEMAVFPGCGKIKTSSKKKLSDCFSEQISYRLINQLSDIDETLSKSGIDEAHAVLQFVISREGILIGLEELEGSNPILAEAAMIALEKISSEVPPIRPAKLKNGEAVNLLFQLPLSFQVESKYVESALPDYPVDEIVLFTLLPENENLRYEVRLFQNKDLKIYEIKENQSLFLGKFLTLGEVGSSEPYKTLMEKYRRNDKILVTDGYLDEDFFEIYIYNLFDSATRKPVYVEVVQIKNQKTESVFKFKNEAEFVNSRFVSLIYRD